MLCADVFGQAFEFVGRRLLEDFSIAVGALGDSEAEVCGDQWFDLLEEEIVELGASLASDLDRVLETLSCDESYAGAFPLQDCIRADGGSVKKGDRGAGGDLLDGFGDGLGGVGGGGEKF